MPGSGSTGRAGTPSCLSLSAGARGFISVEPGQRQGTDGVVCPLRSRDDAVPTTGTTAYRRPTRYGGEALDPRSDLFAFRGRFCQAATGRRSTARRPAWADSTHGSRSTDQIGRRKRFVSTHGTEGPGLPEEFLANERRRQAPDLQKPIVEFAEGE